MHIIILTHTCVNIIFMSYIMRLIWNSRCSPFIHIGHTVNMRCLSLSHNAPQKQHFISAPWVYYNHKLWFVFPSPVCRILFFKDIKWPIRSVSGCLGVQEFNSSGDCAHHKVDSSWHVPSACLRSTSRQKDKGLIPFWPPCYWAITAQWD